MSKRFSVITLIIVLIVLANSACYADVEVVKRFDGRVSTLTPFAKKATYTITNTPPGEETVGDPSFTHSIDPTTSDSTSDDVLTAEPTSTESITLTPKDSTQTIPASGSPGLASATLKPTKMSSTKTPKAPSATLKPGEPTATIPPTKAPTQTPIQPTPTFTQIPPTAPPPPPATPTPDGCAFSGNSSYENQVVDLINQERADRGLSALAMDSSLRSAARRHSEDMACNDFFSHTGSDGSTLSTRVLAAGYSYSWAAENIAASSSSSFSAHAVVSMWMNSSGHRQNILSENAVHIGVGFRYAEDGNSNDYDAFYTANFGRPH